MTRKREILTTAFEIKSGDSMQNIFAEYSKALEKGFKGLFIDYYYDNSNLKGHCLGFREETDKEYENRLKEEAKWAASQKQQQEETLARERAQYERLKKKFEGK